MRTCIECPPPAATAAAVAAAGFVFFFNSCIASFLERLGKNEFYQSNGPDSLLERLQGEEDKRTRESDKTRREKLAESRRACALTQQGVDAALLVKQYISKQRPRVRRKLYMYHEQERARTHNTQCAQEKKVFFPGGG